MGSLAAGLGVLGAWLFAAWLLVIERRGPVMDHRGFVWIALAVAVAGTLELLFG